MARLLAETGERVLVVDRGGIGAGASGRNGGFLFRQPAAWIGELLDEAIAWYGELEEEGPVPLDLREWPMLLLAVEEAELAHARAYAEAVGGEEVDLREDPWLADDLAGGFVVEGGVTLDALGATTAAAEAARRAGARFALGCEAKRILVAGGRVTGVATDAGVVACGRAVVAAGPRLRFLLRTAGADLPISSSRGWLLETGARRSRLRATRSSRPCGPSRRRWARSSPTRRWARSQPVQPRSPASCPSSSAAGRPATA